MKFETLALPQILKIVPLKSEKTIFYIGMTTTSQEVFFYAYIDGKPVQCYQLAEQDGVDGTDWEERFDRLAKTFRESKLFKPDQYNVSTIIYDKNGIKNIVDYYDLKMSDYRIQKEWKEKYVR